jgi:hypothetical protein
MKVTKSATVRSILATQPHLSNGEIAKLAHCDISLVYQLRKVKSVAKRGRPRKVVDPKQVSIVSVAKRKVGRPRKVVDPKQVSIVDASNVLKYLVDDVKDLCISFDHRQGKVGVLWFEELFKVDISELPKTLDSIRFLANHMINYSGANHDNA